MESKAGWFAQFAQEVSRFTGRPITFILAVAAIVVWGILGPLFGFSDTWQLVINTATTIVTFLMVFVIQNTENRDTAAMHIKLDDETLELLRKDYGRLARKAKSRTKAPIRAAEVPAKPGKSKSRKGKPDDD
jgi:low affinity Fe/Cu permease